MNKLWIAATLGAALALAGCASVSDDLASAKKALSPVSNECREKMDNDPALRPLSGKLKLDGTYSTQVMLNDEEKPNLAERAALEAYLQSSVSCNNAISSAIARYQTKEQKLSDHAYFIQDYVMISDLKSGLTTWADFNRRRDALNLEAHKTRMSLWAKRSSEEQETKAAMAAFGQALAQGMQQYGNAMSRAYAPQQQYGSSYAPTPAYEPATTWTSHGNIVQGSNGVTMQSFGNRDVITYPNGQTRNCSTFGNITTCSSPPGF